MNTMEITEVDTQTEDVESMAIEESARLQQPAPAANRHAWPRRILLLGIVLLLVWLAFSVKSALNTIDANMEQARAVLLQPNR